MQDTTLEARLAPEHLPHPAVRTHLDHVVTTTPEDVQHLTANASIAIYTDGSKTDVGVGAAYVAYNAGTELSHQQFRLANHCSIYQGELVAITNAMEYAIGTGENTVIFSDSRSALMALGNRDSTNTWVRQTQRLFLRRSATQDIQLAWVKAHVGIPGNERAYDLAKQSTTLEYVSYD